MALVIVTFVIVLATVLGAYWAFIVRPEQQNKGSALRRLTTYKRQVADSGVVRAPERLSQIRSLEGLLKRRAGLTARVQALLAQSGVKMTVGTFVLACFAGSVLADLIKLGVYRLVDDPLQVGVPLAQIIPAAFLNAAILALLLYPARVLTMRVLPEEKPAW